MLIHRDTSNRIIGLAIEVHRNVGPGLLESVYARMSQIPIGLLMNFRLKDGLRRFVR
jgi:hypothetical protein